MANVDPYADQLGTRTVSQAPSTTVQNSSGQSTSQTGTQSSFTRESMTALSEENQRALDTLITQLLGGGTAEQKKNTKERDLVTTMVRDLLAQYSKQQAFSDAQGLMALNLQQSMEKNKPAIAKSIESAGTSASSMQGLLSQNLARDSALSASALGAEQAKAYAGAQVNLASLLESLSRPDNTIVTALNNALNVAKGSTTTRTVEQSGSSSQAGTTSGRTATTEVNGGYQGGSNISVGISPGGNQTNYNSTTATPLDNAAAAGYDGDLRGLGSPNSWNQVFSNANWFE